MTLNAVSNTSQALPVAQSAAPSSQKSTQSQPAAASATTDTVQLSSAAQAALAAVQEVRETPAQTAREASGGDRQAQRLLVKEAAARVQSK